MAKKRIGVLTGGGDVPGLNSVIKTVTYRSSENDIEVVGLRRGWEALTHVNLDDATSRSRYVTVLDRENTRTIDRRGGTVLHSTRTNPSKMQKLPDQQRVSVILSYHDGLSNSEIAKVMETTVPAVESLLKRVGLDPRPKASAVASTCRTPMGMTDSADSPVGIAAVVCFTPAHGITAIEMMMTMIITAGAIVK